MSGVLVIDHMGQINAGSIVKALSSCGQVLVLDDTPMPTGYILRRTGWDCPDLHDFRRQRDYPTLKQGLRNPRIRRR